MLGAEDARALEEAQAVLETLLATAPLQKRPKPEKPRKAPPPKPATVLFLVHLVSSGPCMHGCRAGHAAHDSHAPQRHHGFGCREALPLHLPWKPTMAGFGSPQGFRQMLSCQRPRSCGACPQEPLMGGLLGRAAPATDSSGV